MRRRRFEKIAEKRHEINNVFIQIKIVSLSKHAFTYSKNTLISAVSYAAKTLPA